MNLHLKLLRQFKTCIICVCVSLLFFACDSNYSPERAGTSVSVELGFGGKALSLSETAGEFVFRYNAVFGSAAKDTNENSWPVLGVKGNTATIQNLKQGFYTIYVNAYLDGTKVYEGSASAVLSVGKENKIVINLNKVPGSFNGNLVLDFTGNCDSAKASCTEVNTGTKIDVALTATGSSTKTFKGSTVISEGSWALRIIYFKNGVQIGGETLALSVTPGSLSKVTGTLDSGLSVYTGINIGITSTKNVKIGKTENFIYASNGEDYQYAWYLDNQLVSSSASYTFASTTAGDHTLKLIVGNNDKTFTCNVRSYYHDSITLTVYDLIESVKDTDKIVTGFRRENGNLVILNESPGPTFTVSYTTFDKLTYDHLGDLKLTPVTADMTKLNTYKCLIIGKDASLQSSSSRGWLGQKIEFASNETLYYCWCYKNIDDYALYGCVNLCGELTIGDTVTYVGHKALGLACIDKSDCHIEGNPFFESDAFSE